MCSRAFGHLTERDALRIADAHRHDIYRRVPLTSRTRLLHMFGLPHRGTET